MNDGFIVDKGEVSEMVNSARTVCSFSSLDRGGPTVTGLDAIDDQFQSFGASWDRLSSNMSSAWERLAQQMTIAVNAMSEADEDVATELNAAVWLDIDPHDKD